MLEIALETSQREASVAVGLGATVLEAEVSERAHASELLPRLAELLARAGLDPARDLGPPARLLVGLGPGSYTGLRVGIASALGLARARGATLHGLSSFEALALEALAEGQEGTVLLDARAGRIYHARYRREGALVAVLDPPAALRPAELRARCATARRFLAPAGLLESAGVPLPPGAEQVTGFRPKAGALLRLARARLAAGSLPEAERLEPLYLTEFGR